MKNPTTNPLLDLPYERRWKQQLYPAPIVVGLIRRTYTFGQESNLTARYLLIKRNGDPYNGCWALVGGKWDFGETLPDAIVREVKEETNLDAAFIAVRGIVSERLTPVSHEETGAHFLLFVCELQANDGVAIEQEEGEVAWFTKNEINQLHDSGAIIPSDFAMLRSFAGSDDKVAHFEAEMIAPLGEEGQTAPQLLSFSSIGKKDRDEK